MVRAAIACLLLLAVVPAFAQTPASPALRPSVGVTPPKTKAPTPPPPPAYSPVPKPPSADQCRAACAQSYYFCLAENEVQDCAPAWSQCRLACAKAAPTTKP